MSDKPLYGIWLHEPDAPEGSWKFGSWVTQNGKVIISENRAMLSNYADQATTNWTIKEYPGTIDAREAFAMPEGDYRHGVKKEKGEWGYFTKKPGDRPEK